MLENFLKKPLWRNQCTSYFDFLMITTLLPLNVLYYKLNLRFLFLLYLWIRAIQDLAMSFKIMFSI